MTTTTTTTNTKPSKTSAVDAASGVTDVTVLGLGDMGAALARTLLGGGNRRVTVWNRSAAKAEPLARDGANVAPDPASAVAASPVTVVCVTDYEATRALLDADGVAAALRGRTLVNLTTGTPDDARDADARARALGADYLDGAILATPSQVGRPDTAVFVSGSRTAFQTAEPLLKVLAGDLRYVGEPVGATAAWELATLSHLFGGLLGFYHGARILETEGIPAGDFGAAMADIAPVIGEMVREDGDALQSGDFTNPQSSLEICWRGMALTARHAREAGINGEFPNFAAALLGKGMDAGYGHEKAPALIKVLRRDGAAA